MSTIVLISGLLGSTEIFAQQSAAVWTGDVCATLEDATIHKIASNILPSATARFVLAFRKELYSSLEELQADVDAWITGYNEERPYSGRDCYGSRCRRGRKASIRRLRRCRQRLTSSGCPITC